MSVCGPKKNILSKVKQIFRKFPSYLNIAKELCGPLYKGDKGKISSNALVPKKINVVLRMCVYVIFNVMVLMLTLS